MSKTLKQERVPAPGATTPEFYARMEAAVARLTTTSCTSMKARSLARRHGSAPPRTPISFEALVEAAGLARGIRDHT
jgi:hypothetical protein